MWTDRGTQVGTAVVSLGSALKSIVKVGLKRGTARAAASCHSFSPATLVLMADGTSRLIKDVVVGDTVLATDPETGKSFSREVTATHVHQDTDLTDLTVKDHEGTTSVVHTTDRHRVWDQTTQA